MPTLPFRSEYRVEKQRVEATVTLSSGESVHGCFFVAGASAHHDGAEQVGELLNAERGFFPFERLDDGPPHTVLYNRGHLLSAALSEPEAQWVPGYDVATRRVVTIRLSNGEEISGAIRVYRPAGRDRISDWARTGDRFRYIESNGSTFIVNAQHIVEISEVEEA